LLDRLEFAGNLPPGISRPTTRRPCTRRVAQRLAERSFLSQSPPSQSPGRNRFPFRACPTTTTQGVCSGDSFPIESLAGIGPNSGRHPRQLWSFGKSTGRSAGSAGGRHGLWCESNRLSHSLPPRYSRNRYSARLPLGNRPQTNFIGSGSSRETVIYSVSRSFNN